MELSFPGAKVLRNESSSIRNKLVVHLHCFATTWRRHWRRHMIKFKIHALECTITPFYVKKIQKISAEGARPPPQTHPPAEGGHPGGLQLSSAGTAKHIPAQNRI